MADLASTLMDRKSWGLLIIFTSAITMISIGKIGPEIFSSMMLWSFAIFCGANVVDKGVSIITPSKAST